VTARYRADHRGATRSCAATYFGNARIDKITAERIAAYMAAKAAEGPATKTISNRLNFAHGLFAFPLKRGWAEANAVATVDRPAWREATSTFTSTAARSRLSCEPSR
jgi:site-specific recombinase XerD